MKRTKPYRVGDRVRIVNSKFVKRVGYPLIWYDLMDEVAKDPRTLQAYDLLTGRNAVLEFEITGNANLPRYFLQAVAKLRVEERSFGGNDRQIFYYPTVAPGTLHGPDEYSDLTGHYTFVEGKRVVKTGKRYPPSSGMSGWECPEYWEESGGLENEKTHVLLLTHLGEIEACNVERA